MFFSFWSHNFVTFIKENQKLKYCRLMFSEPNLTGMKIIFYKEAEWIKD